ncbi:hypothetical protein QF032_007736 [Streptomyces achromogenes]|uniref:hypothetical protein n=1 Tax=Streptomyces achromogenes TaxID=67255 RepID=UPI0027827DA4|nr:hypothetical protein [Streptomyces achromogenes]MDQ0835892.1 hypothetical protein [Streptomyces achromogenes]
MAKARTATSAVNGVMTRKKANLPSGWPFDRPWAACGVLTVVGAGEVMISMTSVMQYYGLLWTDPDGAAQASAGRHDKRSAKHCVRVVQQPQRRCVPGAAAGAELR